MNPELFALSASKRLATDYTDLHRLIKKSVAIREIRGKKITYQSHEIIPVK
jgi:hypothetical protein